MTEQQDAVRVENRGPVTIVTLDRSEVRNAVDRSTAKALAGAFYAFEKDDDQLVAVFHGANDTFCSGADLKAMLDPNTSNKVVRPGTGDQFDGLTQDGPMGPSRMMLSKPVIAAISGYAVAGGMELALWCDMRVMEEDAVMGVFCRRWGVPLIDGGTVRLPRLIGHSRALDLIMTGRPVGAKEALSMGLVNRVAEKGASLDVALELAQNLAGFPQTCLRNDRRSAYEQWDLSFDLALAREFELGHDTLASPELSAGVGGFVTGKGRGGSFT